MMIILKGFKGRFFNRSTFMVVNGSGQLSLTCQCPWPSFIGFIRQFVSAKYGPILLHGKNEI